MLLSEALNRFYKSLIADGAAASTVEWYTKRLKRLSAHLPDRELATVEADDLRDFVVGIRSRSERWADHPYRAVTEGGLSPSTVRGYVRAVKRFFNWLEEEGIITTSQNPAVRLKLPRRPHQAPKAIDVDDLRRLLAVARGDSVWQKRNYAILLFLADTGCRVGGLIGLKLGDVDLDRGVALVTEKGTKARFVMFTEPTGAALKAWLEVRPDVHSDYVFLSWHGCSNGGLALTVSGVNQMLGRLKRRAGVSGRVNPHSLRHGFARQYLLNGGDLASLSDLMGHTDVQVTKEFYSIFLNEELKQKHHKHSPVLSLLGLSHGDN
jgi:site-specific recombinase XerD